MVEAKSIRRIFIRSFSKLSPNKGRVKGFKARLEAEKRYRKNYSVCGPNYII